MTATLKLWQLGDEYQSVADRLIEAGGELTPELAADLDAIQGAFRDKAQNVALYIRNLLASAEATDLEVKRLTALRDANKRAAEGLKAYLLREMERTGETKIETDLVRLRIQQNSQPSIQWFGPIDLLPEPYRRVTVSLDGEKAYRDWKANGTLPDGFVVDRGRHLRIS